MSLELCDGNCDGSEKSLILSAWAGVGVILRISRGGVAPRAFGDIVPLAQTTMACLVCVFWKELKILCNDLMTYRKHVLFLAINLMVTFMSF